MTSDPRRDLPALLAEQAFLRTLARELVADRADDVMQQTMLLALQHRGEIREPRSWLGRIARNVAANLRRTDRRRSARERAAAVPERAPSSAELLLREERRAALVRAVDALPPPLREVVLLRWYEGLPPRRIATSLGLPVTTVWNRLRTALQLLRDKLDDEHRGDCKAWLVPLLDAAERPVPIGAGIATGVLLMTIKTKLAVALGIALVLAGAFLSWPSPPASVPVGPTPGGTPSSASAAVERSDEAAAASAAPERLEAKTSAAPVDANTGSLLVHARRKSDGTAAAGELLVVLCEGDEAMFDTRRLRTDDAGEVRVDGLPPGPVTVKLQQFSNPASAEITAGAVTRLDYVLQIGVLAHGIVVDSAGRPIAGADVVLDGLGSPTPVTIATSAADGTFTVRDMAPYVMLGARAPGYAASRMQLPLATVGGVAEMRLLLVDPGGVVQGMVTDSAGVPVPGAVVRVGDAELPGIVSSVGMAAVAQPVRTGADGRFRALGIAPGSQPVTVRAKGLPPWRGECFVNADATTSLAVVLGQGVTCTGIVRAADGAPAAGAAIATGDHKTFTLTRTKSGADGSFTLAGLPPGTIELRVVHDELGKATVTVHGEAGASVACDVVLSRGIELRGRVLDDGGKAVADVYVSAADGQGWSDSVRADAAGRFALPNCPSTLLRVTASRGEQQARLEQIAAAAGEVTLQLPAAPVAVVPSVRIRGRVLGPDGRPVAAATVGASGPKGERGGMQATGADGSFELGPMVPGNWRVGVSPAQFPGYSGESRELVANEVWDVGEIRLVEGGTARIEVSGAPADAKVQFEVANEKGWVFAVQWISDRQLRTSLLEPGDYEVRLRADGCALQTFAFAVHAKTETVVEARLQPGVRQRLQFVRADGVQISRSLAHTLRRGEKVLFERHTVYWDRPAVYDADGAMTAELRLLPGQYRLEVTEGGAAAAVGFEVGESEGPPVRLMLR